MRKGCVLADRRATLSGPQAEEDIRERVRQVIREAFRAGPPLERRYFPESPGDVPDAPTLTLVILAPEHGYENAQREKTRRLVLDMIQNYGGRGRTYKSGLIFAVAEGSAQLLDEAKTLLALESLEDPAERERLRLEDPQLRELKDKKQRTERNLKEGVWRAYRRVLLLGEDNDLREVDLGLLHPSAAESLAGLIVSRLKQEGLVEEAISPDFLVRNWPPALEEWSTRAVRDAFFASPKFPRLLNPEVLKETIARGVREGKFGYVARAYGGYRGEVAFDDLGFCGEDVELSDDLVLIPGDKARALKAGRKPAPEEPVPSSRVAEGPAIAPPVDKSEPVPAASIPVARRRLSWEGDLPVQKWHQFYMKVLTHFATDPSLRLRVRFEVAPEGGLPANLVEEIQAALRELGLDAGAIQAKEDT